MKNFAKFTEVSSINEECGPDHCPSRQELTHISFYFWKIIIRFEYDTLGTKILFYSNLRKLLVPQNVKNCSNDTSNIPQTSSIALWKPDRNEQKDFESLVLFRNGVT